MSTDEFVLLDLQLALHENDERDQDKVQFADWTQQLEMLLLLQNKWSPGHSTFPLLNVDEFD